MAMDAISSAVSNSMVNSSSNYTKPKIEEPKQISTQSGEQTIISANQTLINKVSEKNDSNMSNEDNNQEKKQLSDRTIKQVVSDLNRKINNNTIAEFGYHDDTNRVTIKIVDKETKDVIREIPPEKTLDLIAKAWELAGILVDEKK